MTERLEIRKLSIEDLGDFHQIHGDRALMEQIPAPVCTREESADQLTSIISAYEVDGHRLRVWGAFLKHSGPFVGVCASIGSAGPQRDIGYRIVKERWGRGFGTELTAGLIGYLKRDDAIKTLTARVDPHNTASIKILDRYMTFAEKVYNHEIHKDELHYELHF